jgi:hypothetical protein
MITYLVICEGEQLLPQPVAMLSLPLLGQEGHDLFGTFDELVSVSPDRVRGVCTLDDVRIPGHLSARRTRADEKRSGRLCIPSILGSLDLKPRRLSGKGWERGFGGGIRCHVCGISSRVLYACCCCSCDANRAGG